MSQSNPFESLDRKVQEETALAALRLARVSILLNKRQADAFYASLIMKLTVRADWRFPTAATDGKTLALNPAWFLSLTDGERIGIVIHEVLHCGLQHHCRRGHRNPKLWNIAADLAINSILRAGGYSLPMDGVFPGQQPYEGMPEGLSAEQYYARLEQEGQRNDKGDTPDPGGCGAVIDGDGLDGPSSEAQMKASAENWQVAMHQALATGKKRGTLPAGLERFITDVLEPKVDWRDVLREFIRSYARNDYTWTRPNRRFIGQGLYMPGLRSEELGDIAVAIDTSGSIGQQQLNVFAAELQGILESYDTAVTILWCDAQVHAVEQWSSADGPLDLSKSKERLAGGGGTDHAPVFQKLDELDLRPACCVCLTDLYTNFPDAAPPYPVLWAVIGGANQAPFGTVVEVNS